MKYVVCYTYWVEYEGADEELVSVFDTEEEALLFIQQYVSICELGPLKLSVNPFRNPQIVAYYILDKDYLPDGTYADGHSISVLAIPYKVGFSNAISNTR